MFLFLPIWQIRDATLLIICWYSLIVSLCMLYVLHTHSNIIDTNGASANSHVAKARSDNSDDAQDHSGWLRAAAFMNIDAKVETTTVGPDIIITANATEKPKGHPGYTLLDEDTVSFFTPVPPMRSDTWAALHETVTSTTSPTSH